MLKFFKSLLTTSIIASVAFLALGLAFIFYPGASLNVLANTIAIMLIIYGVYGLILCFQSISVTYSLNIGTSVIALVLGVVVLANNNILKAIIPIILGIFFIINSITKLRYSAVLRSQDRPWAVPMLFAIVLMVCGALMLAHPVFSAVTLTTFVGILMVVYAVIDLIDAAILKRDISTIENYMKSGGNRGKKSRQQIREAKVVDKKRKK